MRSVTAEITAHEDAAPAKKTAPASLWLNAVLVVVLLLLCVDYVYPFYDAPHESEFLIDGVNVTGLHAGKKMHVMAGKFPWTFGPEGDTLRFSTDATLATAEMVIDGVTDRIGINTLTPARTVDVVGTLSVSGAATFGSTLSIAGVTTLSSRILLTATIASGSDTQAAQSVVSLTAALNPSNVMAVAIPTALYVRTTVSPSAGTVAYAAGVLIDAMTSTGGTITNAAGLYVNVNTPSGTSRFGITSTGPVGIGTVTPVNWLHVEGTTVSSVVNHISQAGCFMDMTVIPTVTTGNTQGGAALYVVNRVTSGAGTTALAAALHVDGVASDGGTISTAATILARLPGAGSTRHAIVTTGSLVLSGSGSSSVFMVRLATSTSAGTLCAGYFTTTAQGSIVTVTTSCCSSTDIVFVQNASFDPNYQMRVQSATGSFSINASPQIPANRKFFWFIIKSGTVLNS